MDLFIQRLFKQALETFKNQLIMKFIELLSVVLMIIFIFWLIGSVAAGSIYIPVWPEYIRGIIAFIGGWCLIGCIIAWFGGMVKFPK